MYRQTTSSFVNPIWLGLKKRNTSANSSVNDGDFYWLYDGSAYTFQAHQWGNTKYTSHADACVVVKGKTMKWQFGSCSYMPRVLCKRGKRALEIYN